MELSEAQKEKEADWRSVEAVVNDHVRRCSPDDATLAYYLGTYTENEYRVWKNFSIINFTE